MVHQRNEQMEQLLGAVGLAHDLQSEVEKMLSRQHAEVQEHIGSWVRRWKSHIQRIAAEDPAFVSEDDCGLGVPALTSPTSPAPALATPGPPPPLSERSGEEQEERWGHPCAAVAPAWADEGSQHSPCSPWPSTRVRSNNSFELGVLPGPTDRSPKPLRVGRSNSAADGALSAQRKTRRLDSSASGIFDEATGRKRSKKKARADQILIKTQREKVMSEQTFMQKIVSSRGFEVFSATLIFLNALFMGGALQAMAQRAQSNADNGLPQEMQESTSILTMQALFAVTFAVELGMKWTAEGFTDFFRSTDVMWNVFDIIVVVTSLVDAMSSAFFDDSNLSNTSVLRVMRILRIVRVVRVIRIMRMFRELRLMIAGLLGCVKSLLWAMVVLLVLFFIFGISLTTGTLEHLNSSDSWVDEENQLVILYFASLDRSILNLYMAMLGGRDWGEYYDALMVLPFLYRLIFMVFLTFAILAVVNIVTGIFVENAIQCHHTDRNSVVQEEMQNQEAYRDQMQSVFEEMDVDNTGFLTLEEFESRLDDERVIAYFDTLKLDVSDARKLFTLLDFDRSGEIELDEFLKGCVKLKGESRALDMAMLTYEMEWIVEALAHLTQSKPQSTCSRVITALSNGSQDDGGTLPVGCGVSPF